MKGGFDLQARLSLLLKKGCKMAKQRFIKLLLISWMLLSGKSILAQNNRWVIDKIIARVNGTTILKSDLDLPRIGKEGGKYTLDELIMEELFVQKAEERHMLPTATEVDRQVVAFKIQNEMTDMSDNEFERQLKQSGFSLKSYKQQLARLIAVENVKRAEVQDKIFISSQDVEKYYKEHPSYTKEAYHLKLAKTMADKVLNKDAYSWEDLGWISKKDLGKDYTAAFTLKKGEISDPVKVGDEYHVIMLVEKKEHRLKTLNECYIDVEKKLFQKQKDGLLQEIEKNLKAKASVTRF